MWAVKEPLMVLPGGGCAEALLAAHLRQRSSEMASSSFEVSDDESSIRI